MEENSNKMGKGKIGIIIAIVLVLAAGVAAYATGMIGGGSGVGGDKGKVLSSIAGVIDESYDFSEAALPGVGFKEIGKKMLDGNINIEMDAKLKSDEMETMGMPSVSYDFNLYSNSKDKRAEFGIGVNLADVVDLGGTVSIIDKEAYLSLPFASDKSFKVNLETLGADIAANEMFIQSGGNGDEVKNISIDLFSKPSSINEYIADYKTKAKVEIDEFVETLQVDKAAEELVVEGYEGERALTTYDVVIDGNATKKLMDKTADYISETIIEKMDSYGFPVEEIFEDQVAELESEIENLESMNLKVVLDDKGKLVHVENTVAADSEGVAMISMSFLGKEYTLDKMLFKVIDEYGEESIYESNTTRADGITKIVQSTESIDTEELMATVEYNSNDMSIKMSTNSYDMYGDEINMNYDIKLTDIVKGKSVNMEIVDMTIESLDMNMSMSGNYKLGTESNTVKAPDSSIEVLKLSASEVEELMLELQGNVMQSLGPLMMMSGF